eukprot:363836-Chlamydomonas_euryale.AAC.11
MELQVTTPRGEPLGGRECRDARAERLAYHLRRRKCYTGTHGSACMTKMAASVLLSGSSGRIHYGSGAAA